MDVGREEYTSHLPTILKHISTSHFIAFDLEMSGIPAFRSNDATTKKSLQERYQELKAAAETFHILQLGITCAEERASDEGYLLRSYNFNLSPLIRDELNMDRTFTYSSGAVEFLLKHGYEMNKPFHSGIPYLTRTETLEAKERAKARWNTAEIPDILISPDDHQANQFMQNVRNKIDGWLATLCNISAPRKQPLLISSFPPPGSNHQLNQPLNRFERRLVHQLVRAEYPSLSTISKAEYVKVVVKNQRIQTAARQSMERRFNDLLFHQIGLRWVTEAMVGGDLSELDSSLCKPFTDTEADAAGQTSDNLGISLEGVIQTITQRRNVIVGHNLFIDLVYFFYTFVGPLPDDVFEFQAAVHQIFPLVVDTKYMATAGPGGNMFKASQLSQLTEALSSLDQPIIATAGDHPSYVDSKNYHEAGFDSFVTAKIFLQLGVRLQAAEKYNEYLLPSGGPKALHEQLQKHQNEPENTKENQIPITNVPSCVSKVLRNKVSTTDQLVSFALDSTSTVEISSKNVFEMLQNDEAESAQDAVAVQHAAEATLLPSGAVHSSAYGTQLGRSTSTGRSILIPAWDNEFWVIYGNKLRAYGTVEEICDLSEGPPRPTELEGGISLQGHDSLIEGITETLQL